MGGVGVGCVGEGDGARGGEADVAGVFVGLFVGEVREAEEAGGGVAGGVDLGDCFGGRGWLVFFGFRWMERRVLI